MQAILTATLLATTLLAAADETPTAPGPALKKIEHVFTTNPPGGGKVEYIGQRSYDCNSCRNTFDQVLDKLSREEQRRLLVEMYRIVVARKQPFGKFENAYIDMSIIKLSFKESREALIEALAAYCPLEVKGKVETEMWLCFWSRGFLDDGLEALIAAYEKTTDKSNRERLAIILRRSMDNGPLTVSSETGDAEAVASIKKWYAANKNAVKPSAEYEYNIALKTPLGQRKPLFVPNAK